jgi:hypothetical protein
VLDDRNSNQKYFIIEEVIHWVSKTNHFNALIAELPLLSPHRNKSSFHPKASRMSQSVANPADNLERHREILVVGQEKCIQQFVPSVQKKLKFHLSHAKADLFIVATASIKTGKQNKFA